MIPEEPLRSHSGVHHPCRNAGLHSSDQRDTPHACALQTDLGERRERGLAHGMELLNRGVRRRCNLAGAPSGFASCEEPAHSTLAGFRVCGERLRARSSLAERWLMSPLRQTYARTHFVTCAIPRQFYPSGRLHANLLRCSPQPVSASRTERRLHWERPHRMRRERRVRDGLAPARSDNSVERSS